MLGEHGEETRRCGFLVVRESGSPWSLLLLFLGSKPRVRSIRFAAGHDAEGSQSHVHFDEKLHDSVVMVTQESDNSFLVKVSELPTTTSLTSPSSFLASRSCPIHLTLPQLRSQAQPCLSLSLGFFICEMGGKKLSKRFKQMP